MFNLNNLHFSKNLIIKRSKTTFTNFKKSHIESHYGNDSYESYALIKLRNNLENEKYERITKLLPFNNNFNVTKLKECTEVANITLQSIKQNGYSNWNKYCLKIPIVYCMPFFPNSIPNLKFLLLTEFMNNDQEIKKLNIFLKNHQLNNNFMLNNTNKILRMSIMFNV